MLRDAEPVAASDQDHALVALARSDNLFRGLARVGDAGAVLEGALGTVRDEAWREELVAQQAMFAMFEGRVSRTLALADPLLARPDDAAYCRGALPAAMIRVLAGRLGDAVEIAQHAFEVRVGLGDQMHLADPGVYLVALVLAWEQAGSIDQAIATARTAYEIAAAEQFRNGMAWLCVALSRAELAAGRVQTAARFAREAAVIFGELDHPGARWGYGIVALSAGQAGAADIAEEALADLDAEPDTPLRLMDTEIDRARAWAAAARGDLPHARVELLTAADRAHADGLHALEAAALHDLTRLGGAHESAGRLDAIAARVDGPLMAARVRCAAAAPGFGHHRARDRCPRVRGAGRAARCRRDLERGCDRAPAGRQRACSRGGGPGGEGGGRGV